ncbi:MAG: hypothetical protein H6839_15695 [Planctomycetes bacterium]|nr:hypothetical protein [Planctomycetota bacterium]
MPPPVGPTVEISVARVLKLEYTGEDWQADAKALAAKLAKLNGVREAVAGKQGVITLKLTEEAELQEETLKKLAKEAEMKFISFAAPEPEPED